MVPGNWRLCIMLRSEQNDDVSDTTGDASSNAAGQKNLTAYKIKTILHLNIVEQQTLNSKLLSCLHLISLAK